MVTLNVAMKSRLESEKWKTYSGGFLPFFKKHKAWAKAERKPS